MEEKNNNQYIDEKINQTEKTWQDKISSFFDKIDILDMPAEKKAEVAIQVKKDALWDKLYWIEIFLSWIIASLGLLINSVAVIIWAMLIAPLLRPMNGISFSISIWEKNFFWKSLKVMILSIFFSIWTWYLAIKTLGLNTETTETLARTSPSIIDLFIAIFSAMVAVLSLRFERLSESVAWVAMAASLMPPLAVVWIELALKNYELSFWALTLFFANLISIILVGIIFFWLYWFSPNNGEKQKSTFKRLFFVIITIIIISIPLINSLIKIKEKINIKKTTQIYLTNILQAKTNNFKIKNLEIEKINKKHITINAVISIPEWLDFYENFKDKISNKLKEKYKKDITLNIELIRTAKFLSQDYKKIDKEKELLNNLESKLDQKLEEKNKTDREYLKKEIIDEIRKIFKEENLKVVKIINKTEPKNTEN